MVFDFGLKVYAPKLTAVPILIWSLTCLIRERVDLKLASVA